MVDESASDASDLDLEPHAARERVRRRALWGVLAAVVVVTGAVVVAYSGDGGPPRLPVALGSAVGREGAAPASTTADMAFARVTYVAGDELPRLGGDAAAYRLTGTVDAARVRALAGALGLEGDPTHDGRLWHLQSGDAVLEVYEESGGSWWYSPQSGAVSGGGSSPGCDPEATDCASTGTGTAGPATTVPPEACAKDGSTCSSPPATSTCAPDAPCTTTTVVCPAGADCAVSDCPPNAVCTVPPPTVPEPPADLPSKAEARKIALDLLGATGLDLGDAEVTIDGPYDGWYVTVEPRLDGVPVSGWASSVVVGSKGAIQSASGTLARAERLERYPLLDTRAAIDRLNALGAGYGGGPVPLGAPGAARDSAARDSSAATADAPITTTPCKVQADGSEICETTGGTADPGSGTVECLTPATGPAGASTTVCGPVEICAEPQPAPAPSDGTETTLAPSPGCPEPQPYPEPTPVEVVLTGAEPVLTMLPASDRSGDVYLLPGYRFSNAEGVVVEVVAVDDESLAPTTTVPDTTDTSAVTPPSPTTCETIVEDDGSGTTHTIQTCPQPTEPVRLEPGQQPELGVGYSADINAHCGTLVFAERWWATDAPTPLPWSTPTEGGTFTLSAPDVGTFVGDAQGTKTVELTARGPADELPGCA